MATTPGSVLLCRIALWEFFEMLWLLSLATASLAKKLGQNSSPKTVTAPTKVSQLLARTLKCAYFVVHFVCKRNEVSKKCSLLRLTLLQRISSTLFAITPHSFNCTVFIQWPAKTAKLHDCRTAYFSPDWGEGNTNFFQLLAECIDAKPNNTTVITLYFKEQCKILNAAMFLLWV